MSIQDYEVFQVGKGERTPFVLGILRSRYNVDWMVDLLVSREGDSEGVDDEPIYRPVKLGKFSRCARLHAQ